MRMDRRVRSLSLLAIVAGLSACAPTTEAPIAVVAAVEQSAEARGLPVALVHKSPTCGCCGLWVDHLKEAGFQVEVRDSEDVMPVKQRLGVPYGKGSCHTAEIAGYFIEGHVPASDIKRLLQERPDAKGLALPGMPVGSPGMEHPDGLRQPYVVSLIDRNGQALPFSQHNQP